MSGFTDPTTIHSAIDTWSGFIYQGKIALYHVLKLLNEGKNTWHLQLDSLEDFAIVDVDNDYNPISLHQVKAVNNRSYQRYREDFEKLETKQTNHPSTDGAFFHLAVQNEKTETEISDSHPKLSLYKYHNGNFYCSLNEVNLLINQLIDQYLGNNAPHFKSSENVEILRNTMESEIMNQVISIHANNHERDGLKISEGAYFFTIPFSRFLNLISNNPASYLDSNYYLFLTKELINQYFMEFCFELEAEFQENELQIPETLKKKLENYLRQMNGLSSDEITTFIRSIMPHREFKLESIIDFKEHNIQSDEFKDAFLKCLEELPFSALSIREGIVWSDDESKRNIPTTISSGSSTMKAVCKRIYNNILNTDFEIPYQSDVLVTSDLDTEKKPIKEYWNRHNDIESDEDKKNNITKWSNLELTKISEAKRKINGGTD